jgi:hypothetical protein
VGDLCINFTLGLYYMSHRDTLMGGLMVSCPIAISPLILLMEGVLVTLYYYFISKVNAGTFDRLNKKDFQKDLKLMPTSEENNEKISNKRSNNLQRTWSESRILAKHHKGGSDKTR